MAKQNRQKVIDKRWDKKKAGGRVVRKDEAYVAPPVQALNPTQKLFLKELREKPVVIFSAPAGSGKSHLTMCEVTDWIKKDTGYNKLTLTRPTVGMGKSLGLLPGDLKEKYEPYLMPMIEVIKDRYGTGFYDTGIDNGVIELCALEHIRGRNFDQLVVIDEGQLLQPNEMYTLISRMADGGKLIILGDSTQRDHQGMDGITWLLNFVDRHDLSHIIGYIEGTSDDIERGDVCKAIVKAMEIDRKNIEGL